LHNRFHAARGREHTNAVKRNRTSLAIELPALFVGLPLVGWLLPVPRLPSLLVLALACGFELLRDRGWDRGELAWERVRPEHLRAIAVRFAVLAPLLVAIARWWLPDEGGLFAFPRARPWQFVSFALAYPLISALPQELVWRSYFFRRYAPLLGGGAALLAANALAFAILHVVYDNWEAPLLSLAGGLLFAYTFVRTRSLVLVAIEHTLLGLWIFALGLGRFFYLP
jgi:membrane protease YdiL (CAAX protease family)